MKRIVPIILIGIMVLSGLGAAAVSHTTPQSLIRTEIISFSHPVIQNNNENALVTVENTNAWLRKTNMPLLPTEVTTYTFPFGTKIRNVNVTFSAPQSFTLGEKIVLSPKPMSDIAGNLVTSNEQEQTIYAIYPETLFDYHMGAGISNGEHVLFLTIRCFPVQYKAEGNIILFRDAASLSITYDLPTITATATEDHNLVIITAKEFSSALQPLVDFKISKGITTKLVTWSDILNSVYFPVQGRDCAEKIKYFIKDAFDQWGTNYVILVGGRYGGIMKEKWWIPVRYSQLDDGGEGSYLTDLYFADLYDSNGNFSTWDSNNNDIFAEWTASKKDILDMYPEVYIGRLPCTSVAQVRTMVKKIITYETTTYGTEWFKKMVVVGGDSAPSPTDPWYEGEEENKLALEYMNRFEGVRLWTSNGNFTGTQDVIDGISAGCGFLFFDGHGNTMAWSTHPPKNESIWIPGLMVTNMSKLKNGEKLPVTVCGGCHNGQFNTSLVNIFKGVLENGLNYFKSTRPFGEFWYYQWLPSVWAWKLTNVKNGGSIATMAYTGLDWFAEGDYNNDSIPDCTQFFSGYANTQFFKNYGVNNMTILGQAHTQALIDYLNAFPPMAERLDCKTLQEFVLLGDPSLQIGGYS